MRIYSRVWNLKERMKWQWIQRSGMQNTEANSSRLWVIHETIMHLSFEFNLTVFWSINATIWLSIISTIFWSINLIIRWSINSTIHQLDHFVIHQGILERLLQLPLLHRAFLWPLFMYYLLFLSLSNPLEFQSSSKRRRSGGVGGWGDGKSSAVYFELIVTKLEAPTSGLEWKRDSAQCAWPCAPALFADYVLEFVVVHDPFCRKITSANWAGVLRFVDEMSLVPLGYMTGLLVLS